MKYRRFHKWNFQSLITVDFENDTTVKSFWLGYLLGSCFSVIIHLSCLLWSLRSFWCCWPDCSLLKLLLCLSERFIFYFILRFQPKDSLLHLHWHIFLDLTFRDGFSGTKQLPQFYTWRQFAVFVVKQWGNIPHLAVIVKLLLNLWK